MECVSTFYVQELGWHRCTVPASPRMGWRWDGCCCSTGPRRPSSPPRAGLPFTSPPLLATLACSCCSLPLPNQSRSEIDLHAVLSFFTSLNIIPSLSLPLTEALYVMMYYLIFSGSTHFFLEHFCPRQTKAYHGCLDMVDQGIS